MSIRFPAGSAAVPPVPPLGDVVRDAGGDRPGNARPGFTPRSAPQISMVSPELQGSGRAMVRPEDGHDPRGISNVTNVARSRKLTAGSGETCDRVASSQLLIHLLHTRIQRVAETVSEEIEREDREQDREPGKQGDPRGLDHE